MADAPAPEPVILVHGTFAYNEADKGIQWWQDGSDFARTLGKKLGDTFCVPARLQPDERHSPEPLFRWSGANSEDARRKSGRLLFKYLQEFEARKIPYHVIAQSHGGIVLWEALCLAASVGGVAGPAKPRPTGVKQIREAPENLHSEEPPAQPSRPLPNLKSCTTVGTPFLHFVPTKVGLWVLVLLGTLGVIYRQFAWFTDYWRTADESFGRPWFVTWFALVAAYATVLFLPSLLVLVAYRWHKMGASQEDEDLYPDRRLREVGRFREARRVFFFAAAIFGVIWLGFWFLSTAPDVWRAAIFRPWHALPVLYSVLAVASFLVSLIAIVTNIWRCRECHARVALSRKAWEDFHQRYFSLACGRRDEAIAGLRKSQHGIVGNLLPRLRMPGAADYSTGGRSRRPEWCESWTSLWTLPWRLIWDWCLRPVYNEIFAGLVDEFVLGRMTAFAHGADITGLELGFVSTTPIPRQGEAPKESVRSGYLRGDFVRRFTVAPLAVAAVPREHEIDRSGVVTRELIDCDREGERYITIPRCRFGTVDKQRLSYELTNLSRTGVLILELLEGPEPDRSAFCERLGF